MDDKPLMKGEVIKIYENITQRHDERTDLLNWNSSSLPMQNYGLAALTHEDDFVMESSKVGTQDLRVKHEAFVRDPSHKRSEFVYYSMKV